MATITLRLVKGTPLTNQEVDDNFSNINLAKVEIGRDLSGNIYYPVVSGLRGRDVSSTSPSNAQVLTWLASSNAWVPVSSQSTLISVGSFTGTVSNANLLSSILEVDGSGSNLDADKLDGNDGTFYLNYANLNHKPAANITLTGDVTGSVDSVLTGNSTSLSVSTSYNYTNLDSRFLKLSNPTQQIVTSYINFQGNVTFSGNVTTISANNLIIDDNFIYLNANNTSNNDDFGFVGNYNDGTYQHAGFFRDSSDNGTWKIFEGYLPEPDAAVNIDTANASFRLANLAINKIVVNNISEYVANTATFSTTTESTLYEFSKNVYSSGKFTITGKQGSNVQISEMLVAQDGTTASSTEYGVVKTSNVTVFTGNVDISGDNVRVRVIGGSAISTKYTLAGSLLDL